MSGTGSPAAGAGVGGGASAGTAAAATATTGGGGGAAGKFPVGTRLEARCRVSRRMLPLPFPPHLTSHSRLGADCLGSWSCARVASDRPGLPSAHRA